jgi:fatty-acyl-CoA synthase
MSASTMMDYPLTLTPLIERAGTLMGEREVVTRMPDKSVVRYRYGNLVKRAKQLAEALTLAGVRRGDRVATLCWNHSSHVEAYFGIPMAGAVLHTLNLRLHPDQLAFIAKDAKDRFLIVDDVLWPLLEKFRDRVGFERVFVVPLSGAALPPGAESYEELLATATGKFTPPELQENEPLGICYTSGTTGNPKGVVYTHRSTVLHSLMIGAVDVLGIGMDETVLPVVPMFHVNAWGIPFACALYGSKLVLPGPHLDPISLLDLFEQEEVTLTAGVPTIWMGVAAALEKEPTRWKLKPMKMIVGGSAAPESMLRTFDRFGHTVIHAWGMTETSPVGTVARLKPNLQHLSADAQYAYRAKQGLPVPLVEVRAVGEKGPVPSDGASLGELQVRGPWVAASYYGSSDDPAKFTADGWFRTGDVVTLDPEGYVKIADRTKDLVKSGGEWISSVDLENALMGHPAVREAAVVGVPHPKWDERPLAVVVLKEGKQATVAELRTFLEPKFARFALPDAILFVAEIPKTSAGKFLKSALREQYQNWKWETHP